MGKFFGTFWWTGRSAGLVGVAWGVGDGAGVQALIGGEVGDDGEAEVLVGRAAETSEVLIGGGPDEVPVAEVVRAVEGLCEGIGIGVGAEVAALNDGLYGLVDVR